MEVPTRQGPRHPGVDGAEGQLAPGRPGAVGIGHVEDGRQLGGRGVGGQPDAPCLQLEAGARPCAGPASRAPGATGYAGGPVPHDGRRPLVGDPDGVDRTAGGQARRRHLEHGGGHGHGVELDQPGEGGVGQHGHVVDVLDDAVGTDHAPRTPEVPTSTTRMLTARRTGAEGAGQARACPG